MAGWAILVGVTAAVSGVGLGWALCRRSWQFATAALRADAVALTERVRSLQSLLDETSNDRAVANAHYIEERTARAAAETTAAQVPGLQQKLDSANALHVQHAAHLSRLQAELVANEAALKDQRELLERSRESFADSFKALSAEALSSNNEQFLHLAKATFDGLQQGARGQIEAQHQAVERLVQPIQDSLLKVGTKIGELEVQRVSAYSALHEQLRELVQTHLPVLHRETASLVKALRQPGVRGRYGEVQLKRVVEMAGMLDHCDFVEQDSRTSEEGRLRPDMIVRLPGGRNIVIDAKTPISAYLEALETPDEEDQRVHLAKHAQQFRVHISALGRKAYWDQFTPTPEMVVMFVPGDAFYSAALQADPTLLESGAQERVVLTTPATLIALLRAVAYGWRQEKLAENAEEVAKLGKDLYERVAMLARHWGDVGDRLGRTVEAYNSSTASMESRVLVSARRFRDLKVSADVVEIRPSKQVDVIPRLIQAEEAGSRLVAAKPLNGTHLS